MQERFQHPQQGEEEGQTVGEEAVAVEVVVLPWGEEVEEERRLYLRHLGFLGKSKRF